MLNDKKAFKKYFVEYFILIVVCLCLFILLTQLFYRQSISYKGNYASDLPMHIEFALEKRGYSLLYWIIGILYTIADSSVLVAGAEALIVVLTVLLTGHLLQLMIGQISYVKTAFFAIPLTFLTEIYIPIIWEKFYKQSLVTQPYHNITYYGMRVFAVCVMIFFVQMLDGYLEKITLRNWCLLSFFLLLSTAVKPSFLLGFSFTLLLFILSDFIKYKFAKGPFIHMVLMGLTVFPSLCVLLWQASVLYGQSASGGGSGIGLDLGRTFIQYGAMATILKLVCSLAFPVLVLSVNRHRLLRTERFFVVMFGVQLAVCLIFTETGVRATHGNFYWGLYSAGFFLFVTAFTVFVKNYKSNMPRWYIVTGTGLLLWHFLSSAGYFLHILLGGHYGI